VRHHGSEIVVVVVVVVVLGVVGAVVDLLLPCHSN
jgi:hypothetical protein